MGLSPGASSAPSASGSLPQLKLFELNRAVLGAERLDILPTATAWAVKETNDELNERPGIATARLVRKE